ncbi:MAG: hypothetical protein LAO20_07585 [Acidobacteriia bacterium]|nr:hypothetical protein [Terriglobia bacterium]
MKKVLQLFLWGVCAFHVIVAIGINFSTDFVNLMASWYGARVDMTPQFVAILHPLGAFMLILGGLAAVAAMDPLRYRPIVYGFAALFLVRSLQRIVFKQQLVGAFSIDPMKNTISMVFFFLLGASLFLLYRYVDNHSQTA